MQNGEPRGNIILYIGKVPLADTLFPFSRPFSFQRLSNATNLECQTLSEYDGILASQRSVYRGNKAATEGRES